MICLLSQFEPLKKLLNLKKILESCVEYFGKFVLKEIRSMCLFLVLKPACKVTRAVRFGALSS